jgi:hypothetical protein
MATTTPNYGWDVPTSTDYVKDGATAIETLGDDIDATLWTALGGAYPGLRLVKKQTIGTGVTSVSVTGAFSAAYENYRILLQADSQSGGAVGFFALNGITTNYQQNGQFMSWGSNTITGFGNSTTSAFTITVNNTASSLFSCQIDLINPNVAKFTTGSFNFQTGNGSGNGNLRIANTSTATGFTISKDSSETMTGGTIYVYGYGAS